VARGRERLPNGVHDFNLNKFKLIQIRSNLIQTKTELPELEKIEIKYGSEGFGVSNIFCY
jgi:hypothetical protein